MQICSCKCPTCKKLKRECSYKGNHPKCKTCHRVKEQCQYKGNHPMCEICGKVIEPTLNLKDKCPLNGEHPMCPTCGKILEECLYEGNHPKCETCGKVKEDCQYEGSHPMCKICGKVIEFTLNPEAQCPYNGDHPKCETCGKVKERCQYKGNHPMPVEISCNVPKATMFIDGVENGKATGTHLLKKGLYSIKLTAPGYEDFIQNFIVEANSKSFSFTMERKEIAPVSSQTITVNDVSFDIICVDGAPSGTFYIGETEVTQELWEAVMESNPSIFKGKNRPVEMVSWDDCKKFIRKLNSITGKKFRLPTEAEWNYAARGGNRSWGCNFSGSITLDDVGWYYENSGSSHLDDKSWKSEKLKSNTCCTHPVKQKRPNELGLYDMSGNVWEWCEDLYSSTGTNRVYRGGGWDCTAVNCSVSNRANSSSITQRYTLGFRLAM